MNPSDKKARASRSVPGEEPDQVSLSGSTVPTDKMAWTVREVAERIGCSPDTIYRMVKSGELPALRHGSQGKIFIARDEIEKLFRTRSLSSSVVIKA